MTQWKKDWRNTTAIGSVGPPGKLDGFEHERRALSADREKENTTPRKKPEHRYLTTAEAGQFLRRSPRSLERDRLVGTGPRFMKAGPGKRARVFYRKEDLEAWLESFSYTSTSEYGR